MKSFRLLATITGCVLCLAGCGKSGKSTAPKAADPQWTAAGPALPQTINVLAASGSRLLIGLAGYGVYTSDNLGASVLNPTGAAGNVSAIVVRGADDFALVNDNAVIHSTDHGAHWSATADPPGTYLASGVLADYSSTLFISTVGYGPYSSANSGGSWGVAGPTNKSVNAFAVNGGYLWAAMYGSVGSTTLADGVQVSDDGGGSWFDHSSGLPGGTQVTGLYVVSGTRILARTDAGDVYRHDDGNTGFTAVGPALSNAGGLAIAVSGANVFAAMPGKGVYRSSDSGSNWSAMTSAGLPGTDVRAIAVVGTTLVVSVGATLYTFALN